MKANNGGGKVSYNSTTTSSSANPRTNLRRWVQWASVVVLPLLPLLTNSSTTAATTTTTTQTFTVRESSGHRRCRSLNRNNGTLTTLLEDLQQTKCTACGDKGVKIVAASSISTGVGVGLQQNGGGDDVSFAESMKALKDGTDDGIVDDDYVSSDSEGDVPIEVTIFLTTQQSFEKSLIIAAGLLTEPDVSVTLLAAQHMPPEPLIRQVLLQHVPCHLQSEAESRLSFRFYQVDVLNLPCPRHLQSSPQSQSSPGGAAAGGAAGDPTASAGDVILCSILNAKPMAHALTRELLSMDGTGALVLDATSVAGLLVAEHTLIPSVMLVESADILRQVLGSPPPPTFPPPLFPPPHGSSVRRDGSFLYDGGGVSDILRRCYGFLAERLQDRLNSLDLTAAFMALNRVRAKVGLGRIRTLRDMWLAPGNLLLAEDLDGVRQWKQVMPNLVTVQAPLIPPCLPCDDVDGDSEGERGDERSEDNDDYDRLSLALPSTSSYRDETLPVVLITVAFRGDTTGRANERSLLQGLALARASMQKFDPCDDNAFHTAAMSKKKRRSPSSSSSPTAARKESGSGGRPPPSPHPCWSGPVDFRVVRLGPVQEVLLPGWVSPGKGSFMDNLARLEHLVAIVSLCDSANAWTQQLGVAVLCLDTDDPPRTIAADFLRMFHPTTATTRKGAAAAAGATANTPPSPTNNTTTTSGRSPYFARHYYDQNPHLEIARGDSLDSIVDTIKAIAVIKRKASNQWRTGKQMGRHVMAELGMLQEEGDYGSGSGSGGGDFDSPNRNRHARCATHAPVVLFAWTILILSCLYLLCGDYVAEKFRRGSGSALFFLRNYAARRPFTTATAPANHDANADKSVTTATATATMRANHTTAAAAAQQQRSGLSQNLPPKQYGGGGGICSSMRQRLRLFGRVLWLRLPDLDRVWALWTAWASDRLQRMASGGPDWPVWLATTAEGAGGSLERHQAASGPGVAAAATAASAMHNHHGGGAGGGGHHHNASNSNNHVASRKRGGRHAKKRH